MVTLVTGSLAAQEKADSLFLLETTTLLAPDSLIFVQDSVPTDTLTGDTLKEKPLFEDIIAYDAQDSIRFSVEQKKVFLYGNANVKYITTELNANFIELDMEKKQAFASGLPDTSGTIVGTPIFKDGTQEFESKELRYNFETGKGFVKDIITQERDGYVQGKLTKKLTDSIYCVKEGWYTTCDQHDHPHFYIRMNKAKMIRDKKVIAGFSNLVLEDVPLPLFYSFRIFSDYQKRNFRHHYADIRR